MLEVVNLHIIKGAYALLLYTNIVKRIAFQATLLTKAQ